MQISRVHPDQHLAKVPGSTRLSPAVRTVCCTSLLHLTSHQVDSSRLWCATHLAPPWSIPRHVDHGRFLWCVNYDVPDQCPPPAENQLQEQFSLGWCGGHDRSCQLIPACPGSGLIRHLNKLIKTAIRRQGPAQTSLFRDSNGRLQVCSKADAAIFVSHALAPGVSHVH